MKHAARFFRVLADEARLDMLWLLFNHRELCVCDLVAALEITQSKASRHLGTLRYAGLVTDRREGLWTHYTVCEPEDPLAKAHLALLRTSLATRPRATVLLDKLHTWLAAKNRGATCTTDGSCTTRGRTPRLDAP